MTAYDKVAGERDSNEEDGDSNVSTRPRCDGHKSPAAEEKLRNPTFRCAGYIAASPHYAHLNWSAISTGVVKAPSCTICFGTWSFVGRSNTSA
jgi:hypothetical protein